jgi:hypothetical protein
MIQYNISLFFENAIEAKAQLALQKIILPEMASWTFMDQVHLFEITSHQEPDSKGYSVQCLISDFDESHGIAIESIISEFFQKEFANQFVYFPSQLKKC